MGSLHGQNPSLWVATTPETAYSKLQGVTRTEVAVIGGGITGLTTALLLKARGVKVTLIDAGRIAAGTSGYTTGKITALHGLIYADLLKRIGLEAARTYASANQSAVEKVADLVSEHQIDCDFSRDSAYTYTENPERIGEVEAEVEAARQAGLDAGFTTTTALPFPIGAAIRLDHQVQIHARRYLLGLAERFVGAGCSIFEHTRALNIDAGGQGPVSVETDSGKLLADQVVVATLLPFMGEGEFYNKTVPSRSYLLAVEIGGPVPRGMYLGADEPVRTLRSAEGERYLLVGGQHHAVGHEPDTRRCYADIEFWARERFNVHNIAYRWSAQDYMPNDRVPYIGQATAQNRRVFVATGFQKWGLSNGTAAAMILADLLLGRTNDWLPLFDSTRKGYTTYPQSQHGGSRDRSKPTSPDELSPGQGAVFELQGEKVAVYREQNGELKVVSAICTHMGCAVSFNTAEQSWDCHCHGSRYHTDGRVIDGPAVYDLPRRSLANQQKS